MDSKNYAYWLKPTLIPDLPPNFILVIENASYYNTKTYPSVKCQ
jgi:hypothetical protein